MDSVQDGRNIALTISYVQSPEFVDQMMIFLNKVSGLVSVALTDGFVWVPVWIQCEKVSLQMLIHLSGV